MDRREVQRLVDARERGQRQVAIISRAVAAGGVALAAVFGFVLAQHPQTAQATPAKPAHRAAPATSSPATSSPRPTTVAPTTAPTTVAPVTTQPAPVLQPPPAPPVVATGAPATGSGGS